MIKIIITAILSCLYIAYLRYQMKMFQQNSYRPERYLRWLKDNVLPHLGGKSKLKFVFTKRMVRLLVTALVLGAAAAIFGGWIGALLCVLLCPFVMLLANAINAPIEKALVKGYIADARRILASRPDLRIIGVTGSFGKTSTKNYLYRILSEKYNVLITPGNFNTTLGVVRTIREQLKPYHQVFIVEMGAKQVGDIKEICDLVHPTVGIVTAVGNMHLETFHSFANIQKTKFELVDSLPSDGLGVINFSSEGIRTYEGIRGDCRIEKYALEDVTDLSYGPTGTDFTFRGERYHTPLLGEGNVLNILGAICVARELGVPAAAIKAAVSHLQSVEHRLSQKRAGGLLILDDAYNSNPQGAAMALDVLSRIQTPGRRFIVTPGFVELGERQEQECRALGSLAAKKADVLVIVNLYNREAIRSGALEAGMSEENIICADNLAAAAAYIQAAARNGDVVLYENDLPDTFK
ncbi:MAG: UDP-N-acetylmuramoyl-tripeptide--D-alanyl-D-alanine ligase [Bacteroidales bacterium]|nr:UDP-N-acetylmuramoyl-tripeptide--D-alanyl-D-alanine ligase [Candidatus Cryptobacteroides aphodequi]